MKAKAHNKTILFAMALSILICLPGTGQAADTRQLSPVQQKQQVIPQKTLQPAQPVQGAVDKAVVSFSDLELVGAEVLVRNPEDNDWVPHRKIYAASSLKIRGYIRNSGPSVIDQAGLDIGVSDGGGRTLGTGQMRGSIGPGEESRFTTRDFQVSAGTHSLQVKVDMYDKLAEQKEDNNQKAVGFRVLSTPSGGVPYADCGVEELTASFDVFPLTLYINGDTDMKGHGPSVMIKGELHATDTRLTVIGKVNMDEVEEVLDRYGQVEDYNLGDGTEFESSFYKEIFRAAPGCRIKMVESIEGRSVSGAKGLIQENLKGSHSWEPVSIASLSSGSQLIRRATCLGDTDGSESGKIGCKDITLMPLRVYTESVTGPVCEKEEIRLPGHSVNYFGYMNVYPLQKVRGDGEMGGNPVKAQLNVTLKSEGSRIITDHYVRMEEDGGDRSTFEGSWRHLLFNADTDAPGCYIREIRPDGSAGSLPLEGGKSWTAERNRFAGGLGWDNPGSSGLLKYAECRTDTGGNDTGKLGCRNISYSLDTLHVDLWPTEVRTPSVPQGLTPTQQQNKRPRILKR